MNIKKFQHLTLYAQWRDQVSLIPRAYPMLYGWGPDIKEMDNTLESLSQENIDEGSDDEQLNCTYDVDEEDNNYIIEETETLAVSDAYRTSDNGLSFERWEMENLWEDVEDDEEDVFETGASRKRSRKK